jgi:hypothetical protein
MTDLSCVIVAEFVTKATDSSDFPQRIIAGATKMPPLTRNKHHHKQK